jgi:hypothetical protein
VLTINLTLIILLRCSGERVLGRWVLLEDVAVLSADPESNTQVGASLK